jgi:hypothetical protein
VQAFDTHVVGCHDAPGIVSGNCSQTTTGITGGPGFLDMYRPYYVLGTASYTATNLAAGTTCATIRSQL